ncbi:hypothetical protein A2V82_03345 [candidate division KSB1 bacterium RBG_16_48_16]|nr:MAG: hypothetical protein A2V82_03345 [candidate division KSB1 bacterium RBG_16_48_16]
MQDVLIALIIIGMVIVTSLRVDSNAKSNAVIARHDEIAQSSMKIITDYVEEDFRRIGHGLIVPSKAITLADSSRIIFSYDKNPSAVFDSIRIEYKTEPANTTENPYDKILIRRLNYGASLGAALGVTRFKLTYFNQYGNVLPTPVVSDSLSKIREIEMLIIINSTESMENQYARAQYVTRFTPKNLLVRYGS